MSAVESKKPVAALRPVILGTLVVCLALAMAPWMSGGQRPLAMMLSGGALMLAALMTWMQPEARRFRRGPLVVTYALLVGFALLSLLWSANRYSTLLWVVQWVMAGLAFRVAYTAAGEAGGREWVIRAYLGSAAVFCVAAIYLYMTGDYNRLTGTFYWANPAAAYLIPAIIFSIDRLRLARDRMRWLWAGALVLFTSSFLLTDSRAATLVLVIVTGLYLLLMPTPRRFWINFVFTLAIGFGVSFGLSWLSTFTAHHGANIVPGSRFAEAASGESKSVSDRFYYLGSAFDIWYSRPVGGTGAGTYGDVHPQYQKRVVSASTNAHNLYVQVLAELGLVGAILLAGVLFWLLAGVLRGLVSNTEMVPIAIGAAGLVMHFGLDIDARYPALLLLVAVLLGVVYRQWSSERAKASWGWPILAVAVMVPLVVLYQSDVWANRAKVYQDNGDFVLAAEDFGNAHGGLVFNPDFVNAEGINLYTLAGMGDKEAIKLALERARMAERLDPHDGQHHQLEGRVLALQGDYKGAEATLREALRLDPYNHPDYAQDLAFMQTKLGHNSEAITTVQTMLAQYPDAVVDNRNADLTLRPTLGNLEAFVGNIYLQEGDLEKAREAARASLHYDKKSLRGRALQHQIDIR
jgi:O-antigen ligase